MANPVRTGGVTAVRFLTGDVDFGSVPTIFDDVDLVATSGIARLVLDLSRVDVMDSSGLAVIVQAHNRSRQYGFELTLRSAPTHVRKLLRVTGLEELLTFTDSEG